MRRIALAVTVVVLFAGGCGDPTTDDYDWEAQQEADNQAWRQERDARLDAAKAECDERDGQWLATYNADGNPALAVCLPAGVATVDLGEAAR